MPLVRTGLPWLAVGLLAAFPLLVEGTYYKFLGIIVLIYGIVAIGLNILSGYAGLLSLGHAALMAVGAYTTALVTKALAPLPFFAATGLHIWFGMIAGTAVAAVFGALLAFPSLRVRGPYLAMVTVAFGWVIWKVLQEWVSVTGGDLGISSIPKPQIGSLQLDTQIFYFFVLAFFLAALVVQERFMRSRFGIRLRAMRHSELGIASVGVDVHALKVVVFVVSAAFAGFGGTLFAHQQNYISPDNFQFFSSVFFLLAILFGGAGTRLGPIIGAAVLTILPELLHDFDKYRLIIYGCFILLTLYFLPNGVVGLIPAARRGADALSTNGNSKPGPTPQGGLTPVRGASLDIVGVSRSFGGLRALSDVTFSVEGGSIHALIGPNGAGKTTLINVASAIYKADMGRILIDGQPARFGNLHEAATQGLARTFQTIKLFGDMTVLEHVLIGLSQHSGVSIWQELTNSRHARAQTERHIEEAHRLIHFVGLVGYEDRPATELAYGHRRLVEIARALATRPRLILLDEPAAGLVAEEIVALAHVIRQLQQSGMTVLLVEHHMDLVVSVSDRITVLDQGIVIADGIPSTIQRDERVIAAYLGPSHVAA